MKDEEFLLELNQIVSRRSKASNLVDTLAFVDEVAERLVEDPTFGEFEQAEWEGAGSRNRTLKIHGYTHFDESDGSIGLVIGKWQDISTPETLSTAAAAQLSGQMEHFVREAIQRDLCERITESNPAYELALQLSEERSSINRIRLHILTNLSLSSRFKEELQGDVAGIPFECHIWDLQRLSAIYQSNREREAVEIGLSDFNETGIPCLDASGDGVYRSYLCVMKANLLADLFDRYGSRLLEGNVRSFLGMRGGVNAGIKRTIRDQPHLFFPYNNGIAATASNVDVEIVNGQKTITRIVDLQIVNGGQTTASILNARKKDKFSLENVSVQVKLTQVAQADAQELIPKIAEYANTQNRVNIADFFANHPFHRKIEEISRRLLTPAKAGQRIQSKWFYERARGQYQNERLYLSPSMRNAFDTEYPKVQMINKTDLGKFNNSWDENPHWVSLGAQKNFLKFADKFKSKNDDQGQEDHWEKISSKYGDAYFRRMVAIGIMWKRLEKIIFQAKGDWYEGGYRPQIVTYTLAKLAHLTREDGKEVDLESIWNKQDLSDELSDYLTKLAQIIQDALIILPEGVGNVGEWCKKELCWKQVMGLATPPLPSSGVTITKDEHRRQSSDGKKEASLDDGIRSQSEVIAMGGDTWAQLKSWNIVHNKLTPKEASIIAIASSLPKKLPSPAQSVIVLKAYEKAKLEGFKPSDA